MRDDDDATVGLRELIGAYARGERTPSDVAAAIEARIARLDPGAHVFIACDTGRLRDAAAGATERWAAGHARPLEGVPVVVKDNTVVDGFPTTAGSRAGAGIPDAQASAVDRLIAAGAIPYAKANMTEYALRAHGRNAFYGDVPAPGAPGHLAGGSSAGSAAAVRLGLAPLALGSDTAGSVRTPAAACGVVGYKPAFGALPLDGVVPLAPTCDHLGLVTARVEDLEPVLEILGAPSPPGPASLPVLAAAEEALGPLDPGVRAAYRRAAEALGAQVGVPRFMADGGLEEAARAYEAIRSREAWQAYGAAVSERPEAFGDETAAILQGFAGVGEDAYRAGLESRARLAAALRTELQGRAVLALPTLRVPAPPVDAQELVIDGERLPLHVALIAFVLTFSLVGFPAIAVPAGALPGGLTASVQLVAAPGDERALLEAAGRLEAAVS